MDRPAPFEPKVRTKGQTPKTDQEAAAINLGPWLIYKIHWNRARPRQEG
jgi:hypothetical protein